MKRRSVSHIRKNAIWNYTEYYFSYIKLAKYKKVLQFDNTLMEQNCYILQVEVFQGEKSVMLIKTLYAFTFWLSTFTPSILASRYFPVCVKWSKYTTLSCSTMCNSKLWKQTKCLPVEDWFNYDKFFNRVHIKTEKALYDLIRNVL